MLSGNECCTRDITRDVRSNRVRCTRLPAVLVHVYRFHSLHTVTQQKAQALIGYIWHISYVTPCKSHSASITPNAPPLGTRGKCNASGAAPLGTSNSRSQRLQYKAMNSTHQLPLVATKIPPKWRVARVTNEITFAGYTMVIWQTAHLMLAQWSLWTAASRVRQAATHWPISISIHTPHLTRVITYHHQQVTRGVTCQWLPDSTICRTSLPTKSATKGNSKRGACFTSITNRRLLKQSGLKTCTGSPA